jgi:hypothetical protein
MRRFEDNIAIYLQKEGVDWIQTVEDSVSGELLLTI